MAKSRMEKEGKDCLHKGFCTLFKGHKMARTQNYLVLNFDYDLSKQGRQVHDTDFCHFQSVNMSISY